MELDVTDFFNNAAPMDYSASIAEIGPSAARDTWRAACDDSPDYMLLDTDDKREEFRRYVKGFGAWDAEEIAAFSDVELNALCLQMIAGDIRESELEPREAYDTDEGYRDHWQEYYDRAEAGEISGRLTLGDDGKVYYLISE